MSIEWYQHTYLHIQDKQEIYIHIPKKKTPHPHPQWYKATNLKSINYKFKNFMQNCKGIVSIAREKLTLTLEIKSRHLSKVKPPKKENTHFRVKLNLDLIKSIEIRTLFIKNSMFWQLRTRSQIQNPKIDSKIVKRIKSETWNDIESDKIVTS